MTKKTVQYFTKEYLKYCRQLTPEQILKFLDDFRLLHEKPLVSTKTKSKLISVKVLEALLETFKLKSRVSGIPYQTQMKRLMMDYVTKY